MGRGREEWGCGDLGFRSRGVMGSGVGRPGGPEASEAEAQWGRGFALSFWLVCFLFFLYFLSFIFFTLYLFFLSVLFIVSLSFSFYLILK